MANIQKDNLLCLQNNCFQINAFTETVAFFFFPVFSCGYLRVVLVQRVTSNVVKALNLEHHRIHLAEFIVTNGEAILICCSLGAFV